MGNTSSIPPFSTLSLETKSLAESTCPIMRYCLNFIKKTPPNGVVVSVIFGIENHRNPSHYDLHIENFNSDELKFSIEYQYNIIIGELYLETEKCPLYSIQRAFSNRKKRGRKEKSGSTFGTGCAVDKGDSAIGSDPLPR